MGNTFNKLDEKAYERDMAVVKVLAGSKLNKGFEGDDFSDTSSVTGESAAVAAEEDTLEAALRLRLKGNLDGAFFTVRHLLHEEPNNVEALALYSKLLWLKEDFRHAETHFRKTLQLDPDNIDVLTQYGIFVGSVHRDYRLASILFSRALEHHPENKKQLLMLKAQAEHRSRHGLKEVHQNRVLHADDMKEEQNLQFSRKKYKPKQLSVHQGIEQDSRTQILQRELYQAKYLEMLQEGGDAEEWEENDMCPRLTERGKANRLLCEVQRVASSGESPVVAPTANRVWPREWYVSKSVQSTAGQEQQGHTLLSKEEIEVLDRAASHMIERQQSIRAMQGVWRVKDTGSFHRYDETPESNEILGHDSPMSRGMSGLYSGSASDGQISREKSTESNADFERGQVSSNLQGNPFAEREKDKKNTRALLGIESGSFNKMKKSMFSSTMRRLWSSPANAHTHFEQEDLQGTLEIGGERGLRPHKE